MPKTKHDPVADLAICAAATENTLSVKRRRPVRGQCTVVYTEDGWPHATFWAAHSTAADAVLYVEARTALPHYIKRAIAAESLLRKLVSSCDEVIGLIEDGDPCYEDIGEDLQGNYMGNAVSTNAEELDELQAVLEEAKALLGDALAAPTETQAENQLLRSALIGVMKHVCHESCGCGDLVDGEDIPVCPTPCPELREAFALIRPQKAVSA